MNSQQNSNQQSDDIKLSDLSDQEAEELIRQQGRRVGFLLNKIKWPDDLKKAFLTLLPEMGPKEIDEFTKILELGYQDQETEKIDKEYEDKFKALIEQYKNKQKAINQKTMSALNALEDELKSYENKKNN